MRDYSNPSYLTFTLSRSGSHPIIKWMQAQFPVGKYGHINQYDHSPTLQRGLKTAYIDNGNRFILSYEDLPMESIVKVMGDTDDLIEAPRVQGGAIFRTRPVGGWLRGQGVNIIPVFILRDPFNLFASRMRYDIIHRDNTNLNAEDEQKFAIDISIWKSYAREALGRTYLIPAPKLFILYNTWVQDRKYRETIAGQLGRKCVGCNDNTMTQVPEEGGGSSFDERRYDGRAAEMKTLERWKVFWEKRENWKFVAKIEDDHELLDLSNRLFGKMLRHL